MTSIMPFSYSTPTLAQGLTKLELHFRISNSSTRTRRRISGSFCESRRSSSHGHFSILIRILPCNRFGVRCGNNAVLVQEERSMMQWIQRTAMFALVLGSPMMSAAQVTQAPAPAVAQNTTSTVTQNEESHWIASGFVGSNFGRNAATSSTEVGGS